MLPGSNLGKEACVPMQLLVSVAKQAYLVLHVTSVLCMSLRSA